MKDKKYIQILGLLAILSTIGYILTLNQANRIIYGWSGLIATVLAGPAYVGVYLYLKNEENGKLAKFGLLFMMAGLPFVAGIYVIAYIEALFSTGIYDGAINAMNLATINGGSFLTFGVSGLLLSLASKRGTNLPGWLQWLGIVAGVLGLFWFGFYWVPGFFPGQIGFIIPMAGMILSLLWQLTLGVFMLRSK